MDTRQDFIIFLTIKKTEYHRKIVVFFSLIIITVAIMLHISFTAAIH